MEMLTMFNRIRKVVFISDRPNYAYYYTLIE